MEASPGEVVGWFYFRARFYDPETGRFLSRDPVWDAANVGGWYTFVSNGPVSGRDPFGLSGVAGVVEALGRVVAAAAGKAGPPPVVVAKAVVGAGRDVAEIAEAKLEERAALRGAKQSELDAASSYNQLMIERAARGDDVRGSKANQTALDGYLERSGITHPMAVEAAKQAFHRTGDYSEAVRAGREGQAAANLLPSGEEATGAMAAALGRVAAGEGPTVAAAVNPLTGDVLVGKSGGGVPNPHETLGLAAREMPGKVTEAVRGRPWDACAEPKVMNALLEAGVKPGMEGVDVVAAEMGKGGQPVPKPPCPSCEWLLKRLGWR